MDNQSSNSNPKIFIANWKSNKVTSDVLNFFDEVQNRRHEINFENKKVIIAPSYPLIPLVKEEISKFDLPFEISSQDLSIFNEGPYTGEVSAKLINDFAKFAIIGHSERRENFKEDYEILKKKAENGINAGLSIIYCVQNENQEVPDGVRTIAYEPPSAIGTGDPDDPQHIEEVFLKIKERLPEGEVLYGGSVNADNIQNFLPIQNLSGFLVGGASLEADSFLSLLSKW